MNWSSDKSVSGGLGGGLKIGFDASRTENKTVMKKIGVTDPTKCPKE
jgi:hypothetical protein